MLISKHSSGMRLQRDIIFIFNLSKRPQNGILGKLLFIFLSLLRYSFSYLTTKIVHSTILDVH